jgi:hypothetical protein
MKRVFVVGGGPAGMMAALSAAASGKEATLFEKNEKLGKKLYLTGKGRCNITNAAPISDFFEHVVRGGLFLHSAFSALDNTALLELLGRYGLKTKTERGGRVFPESDKASDVSRALERALKDAGAHISLNTPVQEVIIENGRVIGVVASGGRRECDSVIVATGGLSYPSTGSTGDGYEFAKRAGHRVTSLSASLVALDTAEDVRELAGLTLKNVGFSLLRSGKALYRDQGELLFTHTGLSGPLVLSASVHIADGGEYEAEVDLKPALDEGALDKRLQRDITEKQNRDFANVLAGLEPGRLIPYIVRVTGVAADKKANAITRQERTALVRTLKGLRFHISGKRPIAEAVITRGGVDIKQIDPSTMQSRLCAGLYFAGEVIDADAYTGGFNLQIAFSTGYLAGLKSE